MKVTIVQGGRSQRAFGEQSGNFELVLI